MLLLLLLLLRLIIPKRGLLPRLLFRSSSSGAIAVIPTAAAAMAGAGSAAGSRHIGSIIITSFLPLHYGGVKLEIGSKRQKEKKRRRVKSGLIKGREKAQMAKTGE